MASLPSFYPNATENVKNFQKNYFPHIITEVTNAIKENDVVVVGMHLNPHCSRAVKELNNAGVSHKYLEYGGYFSMWGERLALKMHFQYPTFPQIFVKGVLIGGCDEAVKELQQGTLFNELKKK
ncbi:hypothetical protein DICPUDRAFT_80042 [Dictyostelium purpureum]|uniref:Glutaredoxin domain-containing protein n=1 Tax=Dictyostelium purpureum TaxID=5786 RepID=F0ZPC7_DICPU|nr:uncharacterized protein DICPUDRAFT_80042 [Dictyostelium purpureum]EGC34210.1 hypothetical protein DICPUDRAFT_80042 [Dictyostelium purpureum]|eukprot:XP_003289262.1 hypothetical protein DICPUDRAFT_80042 [Dictyostelium purpureum]